MSNRARMRLLALLLVDAAIAVALVVAARAVLRPAAGSPVVVTIPRAVEQTLKTWDQAAALPGELLPCLAYAPSGAAVVPDPTAGGRRTLQITFDVTQSDDCHLSAPLTLTQAPTLASLPGQVTTISYEHLQYATTITPASDGRTTITLQWRCGELMCRLTAATTAPDAARAALLSFAGSLVSIQP